MEIKRKVGQKPIMTEEEIREYLREAAGNVGVQYKEGDCRFDVLFEWEEDADLFMDVILEQAHLEPRSHEMEDGWIVVVIYYDENEVDSGTYSSD